MAIYLTNKVFIVTGSASGIGLATAKHLLSRGASLALCDINGPALEKAVAELDPEQAGRTISGSVDITDRTAVTSFLAAAKQKFGKIDGIANVAGTGGHRLGLEHVWETSADEFDFIMNLNVRGLFNVLGEGLQVGYLEEPASIVHVGSMFSARGFNKGAVFSASKHAALGLVKSAAIEAGSRSIRVNTVMPGAIDTPMHRANLVSGAANPVPNAPFSRSGTPEEIASIIGFLLSDESAFVTGAAWGADGGANA